MTEKRVPIRDRSSWISLRGFPERPTSYRNIVVRPLQSGLDPQDLPDPLHSSPRMPN